MFFFVSDKTPALPYLHDFYSATWTHGDEQSPTRTGPIQDAPRRWRNGSFDIAPLPNRPIGTASEFRNGLDYPADVNTEVMRAGISSACWTRFGLPFLPLDVVSNLNSCCIRTAYFQLIALLYDGDFTRIEDFFLEHLGPAAVVDHWIERGIEPAMCIVKTGSYAMVFVSGTTNYQQWSLQGFGGLAGPQNFGNVSTSPIWFDLGQLIGERVTAAGIDADTPLVIAGHSYGAAGAAVFGVKAKIANPSRKIFLLTCGMPKTFDQVGRDVLETLIGFHVINAGDIVPQVPLSEEQSQWFGPLISDTLALTFARWKQVAQWSYQTSDGRKQAIPLPSLTFDVLLPVTLQVLFAEEVSAILSHTIDRYVLWSCRGCGCPRWPFTKDAWGILFPMGCDPAVFDLVNVMPAGGALKFADRPPDLGLVLESIALPAAGGLVLEAIALPTVGGLVLEGPLMATGDLVLEHPTADAVILEDVRPAAGELRLSADWVSPANCPCCEESESPAAFTLTFSAPGYPFDGLVIQVDLVESVGACQWTGFDNSPPYETNVGVDSTNLLGTGVLTLYFNSTAGIFTNYYTLGSQEVTDFTCDPWYFVFVGEIILNGTATGDDVTITVTSVP
jgi:hypothetical protein